MALLAEDREAVARDVDEECAVPRKLLSGEPLSALCRPVTLLKMDRLVLVVGAGDLEELFSRLCALPILGVGLELRARSVDAELIDDCASLSWLV